MIFKPRKTTTTSESSESTARQIDQDLQVRAEQNYIRALMAAGMRTQPYKAPVVADLTDQQYAAMASTNAGARTMGINAPTVTQRPHTEKVGGIRGVTMQAPHVDAMKGLAPNHRNKINDFYRQLSQSLKTG